MAPEPKATRGLAGISIAITAAIALALVHQRAGVRNAFEIPIYRHQILFQDYYVLFPFIAILVAALFAPVRALAARIAQWCGRHPWALACLTVVGLAIGSHAVFYTHALALDEVAVLFQSKAFLEGRLSGQFPPPLMDWLVPGFFQGRFFKLSPETGEIASVYWPGFSLLLTPFTALGVPWLLNPLLVGATVVAMHRLGLALFKDPESAGYVVLLTVASTSVTINGMTYYTMPAHLLANALFALLLVNPSPRRTLLAGVVGSMALVLHNPVPHLLFALPWIAWLALRQDRWRNLGALFAGYAPICLVAGWGWSLYLENLGRGSASDVAIPGAVADVFMRRLGSVLGWSSSSGLVSHLLDLVKLWLWAVPALVALAVLGAWEVRKERGPWLALAGSALLTYFGYFLVQFDQGHGWGFRYFHSAWLALPLFAAAALRQPGRAALASYIGACAILSLALLTPFRALQAQQFVARHLSQAPKAPSGDARVVIINPAVGYYSWDLVWNDPFLREPAITLISRGMQNDRAMMEQRFPQYRLLGSSEQGSVWGIPPQ